MLVFDAKPFGFEMRKLQRCYNNSSLSTCHSPERLSIESEIGAALTEELKRLLKIWPASCKKQGSAKEITNNRQIGVTVIFNEATPAVAQQRIDPTADSSLVGILTSDHSSAQTAFPHKTGLRLSVHGGQMETEGKHRGDVQKRVEVRRNDRLCHP